MGKWKSRYGDAFVEFPTRDDLLEYELLNIKQGE